MTTTCIYRYSVHGQRDQYRPDEPVALLHQWCGQFWRKTSEPVCQNCPHQRPFDEYDEDGLLRLICRIVRDSIQAAQHGMPEQARVAVAWSVIGGMDVDVATRAIRKAIND